MVFPYIEEVFVRDIRLMSFNFGDIRGLITKLLSLANIQHNDIYEELKTRVLERIEKHYSTEIISYIKEQVENDFPHMKILYGNDKLKRDELLDYLTST